jgi:predicted nucleic acid-binding protein
MNWLLDTCVLSELAKPEPDESVVSWITERAEDDLFLSVLTLGEIEAAIAKLPASSRRTELEEWLRVELANRFQGRLLAIDAGVAERWGAIFEAAEAKGIHFSLVDSLIAATSLHHGMTVATRNVEYLERCGARCVNPWQSAS